MVRSLQMEVRHSGTYVFYGSSGDAQLYFLSSLKAARPQDRGELSFYLRLTSEGSVLTVGDVFVVQHQQGPPTEWTLTHIARNAANQLVLVGAINGAEPLCLTRVTMAVDTVILNLVQGKERSVSELNELVAAALPSTDLCSIFPKLPRPRAPTTLTPRRSCKSDADSEAADDLAVRDINYSPREHTRSLEAELRATRQKLEESSRKRKALESKVSKLEKQKAKLEKEISALTTSVSERDAQIDELRSHASQQPTDCPPELARRLDALEQRVRSPLQTMSFNAPSAAGGPFGYPHSAHSGYGYYEGAAQSSCERCSAPRHPDHSPHEPCHGCRAPHSHEHHHY
jgi:hypothetical protein